MLLDVFLPLSLAFIMFSLGLGLTAPDFARVLRVPKAFALGALSQIVLLPVVAFSLLMVFPLSPELAVGVMILSFCPGGVTSNILTKFAGGALALSITLTGVISLISVVTVPVFVAWAANHFMGLDAPVIDVTRLGFAMFLITALPVAIGMAFRHFVSGIAVTVEPVVSKAAAVLFLVIVLGALAANWGLFVENVVVLGPMLILLNICLLALGIGLARLAGLDPRESIAIALETGVQNSTLAIAVGSIIAAGSSELTIYALPAAVYGITMYVVSVPFILWVRRGH